MKTKTNVWRRVWRWYVDWCERINDGRFAPETPARSQTAGTYEDDAEEQAKRQRIAKAKEALEVARRHYENIQHNYSEAQRKIWALDRALDPENQADVALRVILGEPVTEKEWMSAGAAMILKTLPPAYVEQRRSLIESVKASAAQEMGMAERAAIKARAAYQAAVHEGEVHLGGGVGDWMAPAFEYPRNDLKHPRDMSFWELDGLPEMSSAQAQAIIDHCEYETFEKCIRRKDGPWYRIADYAGKTPPMP